MASNPFGITQVDAGGLLQGYIQQKRQSLADQYTRAAFERQMKQDARADASDARMDTARALIAKGAKPEEVIAADPALGFQYQSHAASLEKEQRAQQGQRAHAVGNAAMFISRLPATEQPAAWDQAIDQLVGQGYTDLAAYKGHYDPKALPALIAASADASTAYLGQSDKDAAHQLQVQQFQEAQRHNRVGEGVAGAHLKLDRDREARVTKWGPQPLFGASLPQNTDDLNY